MANALLSDRLQSEVTTTVHYLSPQLTMSLALLLVCFQRRLLDGR